ncbi:uncharacterized protein LOC131023687 [Salvia miltiorrhiza]|uniref:uncharacterized protein LOC131023687 n=1 Tax=Salvia miltiorrhiza TaxID=226208 RepID=UPI0025ABF3C4|nr:uncharacterized protein LOC131023687 [Salvia miltiorrhiza]
MKSNNPVSVPSDSKTRSFKCSLLITMCLIATAFFIGSAWLGRDSLMLSPGIGFNNNEQYTENVMKCEVSPTLSIGVDKAEEDNTQLDKCNDKCRPVGTESLPKGIVSRTSNLEMHPLSGPIPDDSNSKHRRALLAMAVGFKQKKFVNEIVKKFLVEEVDVMLFHYDGVVDKWRDMEWSDAVIHVSATNQTKWWFAKRFLHPDIVGEYDHIFLWDEDLGVENFNPGRYLAIVKEEGLEISQPALEPHKSEVHHRITILNRRSRVHRRYYKMSSGGSGRCDGNSSAPPCVGWVEMMAPVFSRAAWRCAWYLIQNDLIHAWGLDKQLGYCAQGDRTVKVGVVDEQYIIHWGLPTLGAVSNKTNSEPDSSPRNAPELANSKSDKLNNRLAIRQRSYVEMRAFTDRWKKAVEDDECWVDPFKHNLN